MKTLEELKARYLAIKTLKKSDLKNQTDSIILNAMQDEIAFNMENSDTPELDIESISAISEDEAFKAIIEDKVAEIALELDELIAVEQQIVGNKINVEVINFRFVYEYKRFRSRNPQKVYNHYLKKNNCTSSNQGMVKKDDKTFAKQKKILAKFVNSNIKISSAKALKKYNFIDSCFKRLLDKLYFSTTSEDYSPFYYGNEIRYGLSWLHGEVA